MLMRVLPDGCKLFFHEVLHGKALLGNGLLYGASGLLQSMKLRSVPFLDQICCRVDRCCCFSVPADDCGRSQFRPAAVCNNALRSQAEKISYYGQKKPPHEVARESLVRGCPDEKLLFSGLFFSPGEDCPRDFLHGLPALFQKGLIRGPQAPF